MVRGLGILIVAVFFLGLVALSVLEESAVEEPGLVGECLLEDAVVGAALAIPVMGAETSGGCTYQQTAGGVGMSLTIGESTDPLLPTQAAVRDETRSGTPRVREVRALSTPRPGTRVILEELTLTDGELVREIEMRVPRSAGEYLVLTLLETEAAKRTDLSIEALGEIAALQLSKVAAP